VFVNTLHKGGDDDDDDDDDDGGGSGGGGDDDDDNNNKNMPKPVYEVGDITMLWNQAVHTEQLQQIG